MSTTRQADSELHEEQLFNFLINRLNEEVPLTFANKTDINAQDIYEVLVGACADKNSVSTLCDSSENSPPANTVLYHLRTKFEPERLEQIANTHLYEISSNCFRSRWRSNGPPPATQLL